MNLSHISVNGFGSSVIVEIFVAESPEPVTLTLDRHVAFHFGQQLLIAAQHHDALNDLLEQQPDPPPG